MKLTWLLQHVSWPVQLFQTTPCNCCFHQKGLRYPVDEDREVCVVPEPTVPPFLHDRSLSLM